MPRWKLERWTRAGETASPLVSDRFEIALRCAPFDRRVISSCRLSVTVRLPKPCSAFRLHLACLASYFSALSDFWASRALEIPI